MKFNCGLSKEEKKKAKLEKAWLEFKEDLEKIDEPDYEDIFAWWPVRVGANDCRWLEKVRKVYKKRAGCREIFGNVAYIFPRSRFGNECYATMNEGRFKDRYDRYLEDIRVWRIFSHYEPLNP